MTALAEAAAIASIEHEDAVMERVSHLVAERERVTARLRELGYDFPSTYANFVWLPLGERTGEFVQLMAEHALSVRAFGTEGVRVSIGEVRRMTVFSRSVRSSRRGSRASCEGGGGNPLDPN